MFPKSRKYPIHDRPHARAALAYARRNGVYGKVAAKVRSRYPTMKVGGSRKKRRR